VLDFATNFGDLPTTGERRKQMGHLEHTARINAEGANDWTAALKESE